MSDLDDVVPWRQFGALARAAREASGRSVEEVAFVSGGRWAAADLRDLEQGQGSVSAGRLADLCRCYGITTGEQERPSDRRLVATTPSGTTSVSARQLLARFVSIVQLSRRDAAAAVFREDDLALLSATLRLTRNKLERDLLFTVHVLTEDVARERAAVENAPQIPGLGLLVGMTADATLVMDPHVAG